MTLSPSGISMTRCRPSRRKTRDRPGHQVRHRFLIFLPAFIPLGIRHSRLLDTTACLGGRRTKMLTAAASAPRLGIRFTPPRWAQRDRHPHTFRMRALPHLIHGSRVTCPTAWALKSRRRLCLLRIHGTADAGASFVPPCWRSPQYSGCSTPRSHTVTYIPQFLSFSSELLHNGRRISRISLYNDGEHVFPPGFGNHTATEYACGGLIDVLNSGKDLIVRTEW
jgi:hypothetical protein